MAEHPIPTLVQGWNASASYTPPKTHAVIGGTKTTLCGRTVDIVEEDRLWDPRSSSHRLRDRWCSRCLRKGEQQ